jgi:PAT family beta-lactamase induction signal transducer AmpG
MTATPRGLAPPYYVLLYLPWGLASGFMTVTLSYVLAKATVSVGAIAGLVGLFLLPSTWKVALGPVIDVSLTPVRWYGIATAATVAAMIGFGATPPGPGAIPLLSALSLLLGITTSLSGSATTAMMAATSPDSERGAVAGWQQVGQLGGTGLGGGAGLWLAQHGGGLPMAALMIALLSTLCTLPLRLVRTPVRVHGRPLGVQAGELGRGVMTILRTRRGALVTLLVVLPAGLGASANLWGAVAGDWNASADLVALVSGALGGVASIPGCLLGGYLCDRLPRRPVCVVACLVSAAGLAAMALAPHTPGWFAAMVLINAALLGVAWAAVSAVIFEILGLVGAATVSSLFSSGANLPVVVMTVLVGAVQTRSGSTAMLLFEAGVGAVSMAVFAAVARAWREPVVAAAVA